VYASPQVWGRLIPINRSLAETARWKRCVPRARFHSFMASQRDMSNSCGKVYGKLAALPGLPERPHRRSQGKAASLPYPRAAIFILSERR
jgi:hypothetical protein